MFYFTMSISALSVPTVLMALKVAKSELSISSIYRMCRVLGILNSLSMANLHWPILLSSALLVIMLN